MLTDYHLHLRPDELARQRRAATSPPRTSDRYLEAAGEAGIEELGVSEHVYRFERRARRLGAPVLARVRDRRPRRLLRVRPHDAAAARPRDGLHPRARGPDREPARRARVRLRGRLGPLRRQQRRRRRRVRHLGRERGTRTGSGAATSRPCRGWCAPGSTTSSPTPTWSRSGARPPAARLATRAFYYEPLVEAIADTGIAVEVSTAGWRKPVDELYPSDAFAEMCVDAGAAFALSSDAHLPERGRLRVRSRGRGRCAIGGWGSWPSSSAASAAWSRSDDARPGRDRLRQPSVRAGARGSSSAGSRSTTSSASRATPTPTSSPTR